MIRLEDWFGRDRRLTAIVSIALAVAVVAAVVVFWR